MKRAFAVLIFSICLLSYAIVSTGCGSTKTQRVLYETTDSLGRAADTATDKFNDWMVTRARAELGTSATADSVLAWMTSNKAWKDVMEKRSAYLLAFNAWCSANAIAASGTNVVSAVQTSGFRDAAIRAASDLTMMIASYVPSVQIIK